jgi:hypothetical protein
LRAAKPHPERCRSEAFSVDEAWLMSEGKPAMSAVWLIATIAEREKRSSNPLDES